MTESESESESHSVVSDSLWPHGLSMGFSRPEYWSELPGPPPGDHPDPGIKPTSLMSPALAVRFFTTTATWEALFFNFIEVSVQFSPSVVSNSLQPHGLQHARLPCPSPAPRAYSNSYLSSQQYHPTISSSVIPFSASLQSFSASGSFPMSQFFASGGQSVGASASASVLPMNIQDWFPLGLTGLISLQSKVFSRVFSNTTVQKHPPFEFSEFCWWLQQKL